MNQCELSACCVGAYRTDMAEFRCATYSENEAMFPNHGMESHLVSRTEKNLERGLQKNRDLTKKKEGAEDVVGPS